MFNNQLTKYLELLIEDRDPTIMAIEQYARVNKIPIMELIGIEGLLQILRLLKPNKILEIGTGIGYSAIRFAKALPTAKIITIERDEQRFQQALKNVEMTATKKQIEIIFGDALELDLPLNEIDVLFIDAAKGQYKHFFEKYEKALTDEGVIISDNVLFKGYVFAENIPSKNLKRIVNKIKAYNEWLKENKLYNTIFLPIGDGIAVSKRKDELN